MTGSRAATARVVATVTLAELTRRRWAVALVIALPVLLLAIAPASLRLVFAAVAAGWSVAMLSLFSSAAARPVERRLWIVGASRSGLYAGRQLALWSVGLAVAGVCWLAAYAVGAADLGAVALALSGAVLVGVPLGVLIAQALPREMDGALVMIGILALTLTSTAGWTQALPFWSAREYLTVPSAADGPRMGAATGHAAATLLVLTVAGWGAHRVRLSRSVARG